MTANENPVRDESGLFEAIDRQAAIRKLKSGPVLDERVHMLIGTATKAPSGGQRHPGAFLAARRVSKKKIGARTGARRPVDEAP